MLQHGWTLKNNTQWKKSVTKDHLLYDAIYIKGAEHANLQTERVKLPKAREVGDSRGQLTAHGNRVFLWDDENTLKLTVVIAAPLWEYTKEH